jgi:uncharacterized PurR-regulated membrane protein YhhQ (DUF165 family)
MVRRAAGFGREAGGSVTHPDTSASGTLRVLGIVAAVLFVATVIAANYLVTHVGVVPVGFGLMAPAGVYVVGLAFTLRDIVQDTLGRWAVVGAIVVGALVSVLISPALAVASATAFLLSELADFGIYTPLRENDRPYVAVVLSNTAGLVIDSAVFLWLAFGSLEFFPGQVVGKAWMTLLALPLVWGYRRAVLPRLSSA